MLFDIEIYGDKVFEEKIVATEKRVLNARPAMRMVAAYLMGETEKRFDEQGPGWAPLSPDWLFRKMAHGWDTRILHKKGPLRSSVTKPRSRNMILKVGPSSLVFGSAIPYADTMQHGSRAHNIPARPFLVVTPTNRVVIRGMISNWVMGPFRAGTPAQALAFPGARVGRGAGGRFVPLQR